MATTDNRDAAVFDNADTEDVDHRPDRHIAMGHGIHRCVGVALARAQPRVAVRQLLAMTDKLASAVGRTSAARLPMRFVRPTTPG
jgi:cytochrome P450